MKAYSTSGLIGFATDTNDAASFVNDSAAAFKGAASASAEAVAGAKLQAKMAVVGPLDGKTGTLEFLLSGADLESSLAAIDAVSVDSIKAAVAKSLAKGV